MKTWTTKVNSDSSSFRERQQALEKLVADLKAKLAEISQGGGSAAANLHTSRGKLLPRDRIKKLIDPDTEFLEFSALAGDQVYDSAVPAAGIITGIGQIAGHECVVVVNDATVKGGTYFPLTVKKHLRAQEIAWQNRLPCIYLVDSGGAYLPLQAEVFPDSDDFGRIFYNEARMSAAAIPQIAVVMGSCTAGGAYVPAMADESIIVQNQGTIFLGGPPLVKAATGEEVTAEELGGGKVHTSISGVCDYLAENDQAALIQARHCVARIAQKEKKIKTFKEPIYPAQDLYGILQTDLRKQFEVREVIARLVDGSEFEEFKANYGSTLICGYADLHGHLIGIIANNGILFSESAQKGAHFIQLCDQQKVPLLFLQNTFGFMVGKKYEHEGIAKHGAKLVTAVATSNLPKITVIVGGSFGAGNYAMCGRAYNPNFLFTWPNSRISVMSGYNAAETMSTVRREAAQKKGQTLDTSEEQKYFEEILKTYESQGHPYYASARLWDDGVVDPIETRKILGRCYSILAQNPIATSQFGIFRM